MREAWSYRLRALVLGRIDQDKLLPDTLVVGRNAFALCEGDFVTPAGRAILPRNRSLTASTRNDRFGHTSGGYGELDGGSRQPPGRAVRRCAYEGSERP